MLKKSLAFGLLVTGLMIAPTAAFAGSNQSQDNVQTTEQNGAAMNGSVNAQDANSVNVQRQNSQIRNGRGYRGYYGGYQRNGNSSQRQRSDQDTVQNGAAYDGSTNGQTSNTVNRQSQGRGSR